MLMYGLFVAIFLLAECYAPQVGVVIACVPAWLAMIWCGWVARGPVTPLAMDDLYGTPNFVLDQYIKIQKRLWLEARWLFLTFVIFQPLSLYALLKS